MINPVQLAKDNGLWPNFEPRTTESGDTSDEWRDSTRAKIKKLMADYVAWAKSDKGIVDDPGHPPALIEMPLRQPDPHDSEEVHKKFRQVTDRWYDEEFLRKGLPERELWATAAGLWQEQQEKIRVARITRSRSSLRWLRFVAYVVVGTGACLGTLAVCSAILDTFLSGLPAGLMAVLSVFGVDFVMNKLEDHMDRKLAEVSTRREREEAEKARVERQQLLQRFGIPDDTGGAPATKDAT